MSITLHIQLISKPEMTVQQAQDHIARYFPGIDAQRFEISSAPDEGVVHLSLNQDELTNEQRDWLHLTPFAARYIDGYTVEKLPENPLVIPIAWGVSEDGVPEE